MYLKINLKTVLRIIIIMGMTFLSLRIDSIFILTGIGRYNSLPYFVTLLYGVLLIYENKGRFSNITLLILAFWGVMLLSSSLSDISDFEHALYTLTPSLSITLMAEYYMRKNKEHYLYALTILLVLLMVIDIYTELKYPNGLYDSGMYSINWFLGYKTARVRAATLPAIAAIASLTMFKKEVLGLKFYIVSGLAITSTVLSQNIGGSVAVITYCILLLLIYSQRERVRKLLYKLFNLKFLFLVLSIFTLFITFVQNVSAFERIITVYLGKTLTLGNRFRIWDVSFELFKANPVLGKGYVYSDTMSYLVGFIEATQPHSLLLGILLYTGIIGCAIFIRLVVKTLSNVNTRNLASTTFVWGLFLIINIFLGITSMMLFSQFLFAAMVITYHLRQVDYENY